MKGDSQPDGEPHESNEGVKVHKVYLENLITFFNYNLSQNNVGVHFPSRTPPGSATIDTKPKIRFH